MNPPTLQHKGSLITVNDGNVCLGYLMPFEGRGVYDATFGKVDVTPEEANTHNQLLSDGEINGLDENCKVGMSGSFYYIKGKVQTFIGTVVADGPSVHATAKSILFERLGKKFRGRLRSSEDYFTFTRIS
jgi:hypothetical protein